MTTDLVLSFAMTPYDRVVPLINGEVKPAGITLEYQGMPGAVPQVFYDQIKFHRYDVSEFSFSSFLVDRAKGLPYRLLPIFHNRNFSYTNVVVNKKSVRQDHPEDLVGKRFAVMDYQQTAALWIRGVLQHEFNVRQEDVTWVQTRGQNFSHFGASGGKLARGVKLEYADAAFPDLFLRGEIDAAMGWGTLSESTVDRKATTSVRNNPDFGLLFTDPKAEAIRYYKKNGIYPPHHCTVVRESIVKEHPWVASSLMQAFEESKRIAIQRLGQQAPTLLVFGNLLRDEAGEVFGPDPFPYGIKANAKVIDMVQTISLEQGLTPRKQPLEELFAEELFVSEERL